MVFNYNAADVSSKMPGRTDAAVPAAGAAERYAPSISMRQSHSLLLADSGMELTKLRTLPVDSATFIIVRDYRFSAKIQKSASPTNKYIFLFRVFHLFRQSIGRG